MSQKRKTGSGKTVKSQAARPRTQGGSGARTFEARRSASPAPKVNWTIIWILLGLGLVVGAVGWYLNRQNEAATTSGQPAEISVAEAADKRVQGAFILDVREPDEWQAVHIPDATLIPLGELAGRAAELPRDQEIVVVCRSGNRSATGRDILKEAGFEQVTSMAGGMNEWQAQGYPTVTGP